MAVEPQRIYEMSQQLAQSVKDFCEEEAPSEWDGGSLGYEVGGLHKMACDLLGALGFWSE